MRHAAIVFGVLASFGAVLAQPTLSSDGDADVYGGVRAGFIRLDDVDDEGSFNMGLVAGTFVGRYLTIDGSVDFQANDFVIETDDVTIVLPPIERKTTAFQLGLGLMPFPEAPIRPYATGGVGYYLSRYTDGAYDDRIREGGYYAGVGFDALAHGSRHGRVSLVGEVRWLFTRKEQYAEEEIRADGYTATLGLRLRL